MKNTRSRSLILMAIFVSGTFGMVGGFVGSYIEDELRISQQNLSPAQPNGSASPINTTTTNLESLITQTTPSVVNITNSSQTTGFFGQSKNTRSAGTGVVLTNDGYILTNKHVVADQSDSAVVEIVGGTSYPAKIIALSPDNDLAVIKIDATNLTPIRMGDSSNLVLGQSVIAVGNTLGEFQNTVTEGIISGLDRTVIAGDSYFTEEQLTGLLQTDAAINPGNSGGPLIDQKTGTMIGINTAASTEAQNIGLAIPVNQAKDFIKDSTNIVI